MCSCVRCVLITVSFCFGCVFFYYFISIRLSVLCSCVRKGNTWVVTLLVSLLGSGQGREGQVRKLRAVTCLLIQSNNNNNNQVRTGQRRVWMTWPQYCCLRLFLYTCLKHEGTKPTKQEQTREYIVYFKKVVGSGLITKKNFRSKNTLNNVSRFIHSVIHFLAWMFTLSLTKCMYDHCFSIASIV